MRWALGLALVALPLGCAKGPTQPVIDAVQVSTQPGASGGLDVTLLLTYHDPSDGLASAHIEVPQLAQTYDPTVSAPNLTGVVRVLVRFPANTPKGPMDLTVTLVDDSGESSAPVTEMVTIP
jgi:hypothetical protein